MELLSGNFYFVSDSFFDKVNDPNLKRNYDSTKRPHYFALYDEKTSLYWLIPCSSRVEKYKKLIEKKRAENKRTDSIMIVSVQNEKSVLLLQDMFPVNVKYIAEQYIRGGQAVRIADPKVINKIRISSKRIILLLRKGIKFTPTQADVIRIEKLMSEEL